MRFLFHSLSYYLKNYPLRTNLVLSTSVGFFGDAVCQTVYEPWMRLRPPLSLERLPNESKDSFFLVELHSPFLWTQNWWRTYKAAQEARRQAELSGAGTPPPPTAAGDPNTTNFRSDNTLVLLDLRRSFIFCSFTFLFGVPFFLRVYHYLDRLIDPKHITKRSAIAKGFLSYVAAQLTNPVYLTYVTALDHFFIYRDGRDGRRRVMAIPSAARIMNADHMVEAGDEDASASRSLGRVRFLFSPFRNTSRELDQTTVHKMGNYYRFVDNTDFNFHEYYTCVSTDVKHKLVCDFPDIMKYGLFFWSANWLPMFYYIPGHFRLAYSSVVQVVWSGIMSHMLHREEPKTSGETDGRTHRLHTH